MLLNGTGLFNDIDHHQVVAIASCFLPVEKSNEQIRLQNELAWPLRQLQDTARQIAEVRLLHLFHSMATLFS